MKRNTTTLDLVIEAGLKLNAKSGERENVLSFIRSCYCCRVSHYDMEAALKSLARLSEEEQHALIAWVVQQDKVQSRGQAGARSGCR